MVQHVLDISRRQSSYHFMAGYVTTDNRATFGAVDVGSAVVALLAVGIWGPPLFRTGTAGRDRLKAIALAVPLSLVLWAVLLYGVTAVIQGGNGSPEPIEAAPARPR